MIKRFVFMLILMLLVVPGAFAKYHTYAFFAGAVPNSIDCYKVLVFITYGDPGRGEVIKYYGIHYLGKKNNPCPQGKVDCTTDPQYSLETDAHSPECFATLQAEDTSMYTTMHAAALAAVGMSGKPLGVGASKPASESYFQVAPTLVANAFPACRVVFPKPLSLGNLRIEVISADGSLIKQQPVGGNSTADISLPLDIPHGIYFVRLVQMDRVLQTERMVIQ